MNLNFINEIWEALTQHIQYSDRAEAAESLVNLLIDNDFEVEDIKDAFHGNREVLTALKDYSDSIEIDDEYDDADDSYDEYDDE